MQRWLAGLDDALVAKPLKVVPFIKFSNWRMVLFSIIGMYFLLAWGSFDGPDYQRYVPLVEVAFYFGTILLHEFGHAFMFLIFGHRPVTIGIKLWGDAFAMGSKVSRSEFEDGMICIGGILFCIIAAILIFPMIFPLHDIILKNTSKGVKFSVLYNPDILKPILAWSLIMIIIFINGLNMTSFCGSDGEGVLRVLFPTLHLRKLASIAVLCCMMTMFDARISFVLGSLVIINTNNRKFDKRLYIVPENVAPANSIQKLILGTLFVVVISLYIVVGQTASFAAKPLWNWS